MKIIWLTPLIAVALATATINLDREWNNFKLTYNKQYKNEVEETEKRLIFVENIEKIQAHNQLYEQGKSTYRKGINQFTDLTGKEFIAHFTQHKRINKLDKLNQTPEIYKSSKNLHIPESIDYREKGVVNAIKNQGNCGSCWAFSVVAAIESKHALENNELLTLSEQFLVDCSVYYGNNGCRGGWLEHAFDYVIDYGIELEVDYPYEAANGECRLDAEKIVLNISGYKSIESGNEEQLQIVVGNEGPAAASIFVTENLQNYASGVFYDENCSSDRVNHDIAIIGYSSDNGNDYWLVRNSWGDSWGEDGYFRIARNNNSHCAIAYAGIIPVL